MPIVFPSLSLYPVSQGEDTAMTILFMTMNKVANIFTRMCDVTFALISNLINKRTEAGAGMASLMHGFQCWLSC